MEKEENQTINSNDINQDTTKETAKSDQNPNTDNKKESSENPKEEIKEPSLEEKISTLVFIFFVLQIGLFQCEYRWHST